MAVNPVQTEPLKEILGELFSLLETLEANNIAILQFLREQGIAPDQKLSPYLEQAGRASNVKWLAARRRMEHLLTPIVQKDAGDDGEGKKRAEGNGSHKDAAPNEKSADKASVDRAQALGGKPVQSAAESTSNKEEQAGGERTPGGEKTDGAAAKSGSGNQEQRNTKPQERQSK